MGEECPWCVGHGTHFWEQVVFYKGQGRLKCSARAVQLFGRLVVVETHTLWHFGHHCCLIVGFDALGIWHFWMFTQVPSSPVWVA